MNLLKRYRFTLLGLFLGAIAGYFYFHFIGCDSARQSIVSNPLNSTAYGAAIGILLFMNFRTKKSEFNS